MTKLNKVKLFCFHCWKLGKVKVRFGWDHGKNKLQQASACGWKAQSLASPAPKVLRNDKNAPSVPFQIIHTS